MHRNPARVTVKLEFTIMSGDAPFPMAVANSRERVAERKRNAARPLLLKIATFCMVLSGASFAVSFIVSFVMSMKARESVLRESTGSYHATVFRVLQLYWEQNHDVGLSRPGVERRAFARGLVEGKQVWLDLGSFLEQCRRMKRPCIVQYHREPPAQFRQSRQAATLGRRR
jgi:hypothetical protein